MELLRSLKGYKSKYLINDLLSGLLVAIIAMPLSIALGMQSVPDGVGSGIQMGIITAIVAGFFVSFFGGSRFQIGGPTAAFVVIIYGYLNDPSIGLIGLQIATIIAGLLLLVLGFLKCGSLVKFIPYPIVVGFTTGIGITLLVSQFKDFFGFSATGVDFVEKIIAYVGAISSFNLATFLIGLGTLAAIYLIPLISKKLPSQFLAIVLFTFVNILVGGQNFGVKTIGDISGNITATFNLINFSNVKNVKVLSLIVPSIVIAFLGALESLLSATVADGMSKQKSNFNQELLGQGVANVASSLLGGLPATGAIARTSANIKSGAKSSLAGIFHALFMLIMYFVIMDVIKYIPLCALAAVLINVSINICNPKLFIKMSKFGVRDVLILYVTMLLTVFFDLTYGVIGGLVLTLIINALNIKIGLKINKVHDNESIKYELDGSLYFITVNKLITTMLKDLSTDEIIVDFTNVSRVDCSAIEKLSSFNKELTALNKTLTLANYNNSIKRRINLYYNSNLGH